MFFRDCKVRALRRGGAEGRSPAGERSEADGGPQRQDPAATGPRRTLKARGTLGEWRVLTRVIDPDEVEAVRWRGSSGAFPITSFENRDEIVC